MIVDSFISFLKADEDENNSKDVRALFDRCKALTAIGATVIIIHHTNRNGETRGSSDFVPAGDQALLVSNTDRKGGRLLDVITLRWDKSRYAHSKAIEYHYESGRMMRSAHEHCRQNADEVLVGIIRNQPGIGSQEFERLARERGIKREPARRFLENGDKDGSVRVVSQGRRQQHFWAADDHPASV